MSNCRNQFAWQHCVTVIRLGLFVVVSGRACQHIVQCIMVHVGAAGMRTGELCFLDQFSDIH